MRIAGVQTRPVRGGLDANLARHLQLVEIATARRVEIVAFPELSLTGYEPALAGGLAMGIDDPRLAPFQRLADARRATIAVGLPVRGPGRPRIGLALFEPDRPRRLYAKRFLHADEEPFFAPGEEAVGLAGDAPRVALAICYELSVPEHALAAFGAGAGVYLASVAKTAAGVTQAASRLAAVAREHGAFALMVNCVGPSGDGECAGGSAAWDRRGRRLAGLDAAREGLVVLDTGGETAVAEHV